MRRWFAVAVGLIGTTTLPGQPPPAAEIAFFEHQIRPLLVSRCVSCHGADKAKGGLRLDSRAAVLRGGEGGEVAVPGKPAESRLLAAVRHEGELRMPPSGKLTDREIAALERWIAGGLAWPEGVRLAAPDVVARAAAGHWAFQPVRRPAIPAVRGGAWCRTPIDRFILAKLEAAGIAPAPAANPRTLIRRVTFDLTGLPPTPEEVATFLGEVGAQPQAAYAALVERLLASPHYGERWGRHWLDVARYADNKGYVFFEDKEYPWAYTYRDYVIAAFNGDLPYDRFLREQLAADQLVLEDPHALAALGFLTLGGHFMNNTHDIIDDRIDVVTRGLLGLTVTCARCHDHKFDPVPAADYYALYGVFRSCTEPTVPPLWGPAPATAAYQAYHRELQRREQELVDFVTARHRELVAGARARAAEYLLAAHVTRGQPPADDFMLIADRGDLNPTMITRWRQYHAETRKRRDPLWAPWHALADLPDATFAEEAPRALAPLAIANRLVRVAFAAAPRSMKETAERYGRLLQEVNWQWQAAQDLAAELGRPAPERLADADAEELRGVLYGPRAPADAPLALDWGFLSLFPDRGTQAEYQKLLKAVEAQAAKGPPRAMVLRDADRPFDPQVFERGQPGRPGERVPRQFLAAVNPARKPFTRGSGRLELADEIASPRNPLTARVLVNRVWLHHFGTGLVRTPGDFGLRGEPPTHPELLDYLAADFMDHGWSIKRLHRQILSSAVYLQASHDRTDTAAADPDNRLYGRMNRRRLDFEALHDSLLAVSGGLQPTLGGPPVRLFTGARRRAVYGYVDRLEFPSLLSTFDVPSPAASNPQRTATTVAPQALFLLNGPLARDAARRLTAAVGAVPVAARLDALFQRAFGRPPTAEERALAAAYVAKGPEGERWVDLAHGLLLANEFAFVD